MLLAPSASPFEICGYLLRCCEKINPQRIISDMDVGGSRQERVRSANSSLSSCTGMYNCLTVYFKRLTESYILRAATGNPQRIRSGIDAAGSTQKRRFCAMHKSRRQNAQGWAGDKSETSFGTKLVLYRCTWTYIGREVHGCTLLNRLFQKAYGKCVFKSGGGVCIYFVLHKINTRRFRSGMDAAGSTQKRVCLQTRSPK